MISFVIDKSEERVSAHDRECSPGDRPRKRCNAVREREKKKKKRRYSRNTFLVADYFISYRRQSQFLFLSCIFASSFEQRHSFRQRARGRGETKKKRERKKKKPLWSHVLVERLLSFMYNKVFPGGFARSPPERFYAHHSRSFLTCTGFLSYYGTYRRRKSRRVGVESRVRPPAGRDWLTEKKKKLESDTHLTSSRRAARDSLDTYVHCSSVRKCLFPCDRSEEENGVGRKQSQTSKIIVSD